MRIKETRGVTARRARKGAVKKLFEEQLQYTQHPESVLHPVWIIDKGAEQIVLRNLKNSLANVAKRSMKLQGYVTVFIDEMQTLAEN